MPSTIPPEILPTSARPDIVIVSAGCISMVELPAPWNTEDSLASAKRHKSTQDNYQVFLGNFMSQTVPLCLSRLTFVSIVTLYTFWL